MGGALDAIESWVAGQGYWVQVVVLLGVLLPLGFWLAGVIDRLVDRLVGHSAPGASAGSTATVGAAPAATAGPAVGAGPGEGSSR